MALTVLYNVRQEKRGRRRVKRRCDSDANDYDDEQQEQEISYTIQMLRRLLRGSMPRRLYKTHH